MLPAGFGARSLAQFFNRDWIPAASPEAIKHNEIINPVIQNGTFLQNPGLEPSDLAIRQFRGVPRRGDGLFLGHPFRPKVG